MRNGDVKGKVVDGRGERGRGGGGRSWSVKGSQQKDGLMRKKNDLDGGLLDSFVGNRKAS